MRLRLLPAAALALVALLGMKLAGLSDLIGAARAEEAPTNEAAEDAAPPAAPPQDDAKSGPTPSEADVLESLAQRREALDARERDLDMREKVIAAAEKRIEGRIVELKAIETRIETLFGKQDAARDKQIADLVKMYETMKPANAAVIFNDLDAVVLLDVMARMKPAKAAPILAAMKSERAQMVTVELARRHDVPEAADAPPAKPSAEARPAAPPAPGG